MRSRFVGDMFVAIVNEADGERLLLAQNSGGTQAVCSRDRAQIQELARQCARETGWDVKVVRFVRESDG